MPSEDYMSFLVRLWRNHPVNDRPCTLQGEIEQVQTGTRLCFSTHGELLAFLHQVMVAWQADTQPTSEEPSNRS